MLLRRFWEGLEREQEKVWGGVVESLLDSRHITVQIPDTKL